VGALTSRRSVLMAAAGGFVATGVGAPGRHIAGGIVGASAGRGHLVRDGVGALPAGGTETCDVVVVGGGVAGLSAAWRLAPTGANVRVLELEPFVGGTSTAGSDGVVPYPWGAHYLPAPNPEARAALRLLDDMGVLRGWDATGAPRFDPRVLCHAPDERLFYRGAWHPGLVPGDALDAHDRAELDRFTDVTEALSTRRGADGRFLFQIPLFESSRDPDTLALDRLSMQDWLDREGYTSPFLRWYVRYATLDDFGGDPSDVSAWAGLHYFTARKLKTPELEGSHFLVWPEGNGKLVHAMAGKLAAGALIHGAVVVGVEPGPDEVTVRYVDVATRSRRSMRARAAVLAVPAFVARRLLASAVLPERKSSPWLVCNLHVDRPLEPDAAWDSVLFEGAGLGYVDASHQLTPPGERTVLTYFRAFGDADVAGTRRALLDSPWESLAGSALEDLAVAHPDLGDRTHRIDAMVWGHAMPRPTPGFLGPDPFREQGPLAARVAWAHVDVPGMALFEEAQRSGVRAAEAMAAAIGLDVGETWT
jgi:glycine/D-amino acid oxidase-like deaminating enzyme